MFVCFIGLVLGKGVVGKWIDGQSGEYGDLFDVICEIFCFSDFVDVVEEVWCFFSLLQLELVLEVKKCKLVLVFFGLFDVVEWFWCMLRFIWGILVGIYLCKCGLMDLCDIDSFCFYFDCYYCLEGEGLIEIWFVLIGKIIDFDGRFIGVYCIWFICDGGVKVFFDFLCKVMGDLFGNVVWFGYV